MHSDFPTHTSSSAFLDFDEKGIAAKNHDISFGGICPNRLVDNLSQDSNAMESRAIVTREVVNIKKEISFHDVYVHLIALV